MRVRVNEIESSHVERSTHELLIFAKLREAFLSCDSTWRNESFQKLLT